MTTAEVVEKMVETGAVAVQIGAGAGRVKQAVAGAIEDGIDSAKRASRHSRRAAEDFLDDAKYHVKQRPFGSIGISFGIGLALGTIAGILVARNKAK
jgi:ElaB/YqjD/DUF883 family membrane-anchored ribosome-binding protein